MNPAAMPWLVVAVGGALGSTARYGLSRLLLNVAPGFPLATLTVNIVGSFLIGLVGGVAAARPGFPELWRLGLTTGVMGGFTTFSAFSLETLRLFEQGSPGLAAANVLLNLVLSLGACAIGLWLGRLLA